jgi:hypothetical protein
MPENSEIARAKARTPFPRRSVMQKLSRDFGVKKHKKGRVPRKEFKRCKKKL